ncbi:MAG: ATP synthase F0 subunit C [Candidatus Aminicenantes bacterium]|jgi:F-type H+-transporting ATPase subunit c|nr:ATP synthase F0 subunit C [Candidatus Aminicenantes bacterium]
MKKVMLIILVMLALSLISITLPAQETQAPANAAKQVQGEGSGIPYGLTSTSSLFIYAIYLGIIGLTAAAISGAFAQSKALRTAVENIGRNPSAADAIRGIVIIGLALIESLVIYVLLVNLILFFVKWNKFTF